MNRLKSIFKTNDFMVFLITMFLFGTATGLFAGVLNNYLAEILSISKFQRGIVEFFRELPGLSLIFLLALFYKYSETKIIRIALFVSLCGLVGLILTGPNRMVGIILIMLWSTGEHILMPVRQSISIHSAHPGKEGRALGITGSFSNFGLVSGYYLVPVIFLLVRKYSNSKDIEPVFPFKAVYLVSAVFVIIGILFLTKFHKKGHHVDKKRFYIRKKYTKYYILEMFFGARKQIFLTFAPFVLILNYGASTELIALLYGIYSLINIFLNPLMGKLLDKVGYKIILIADSIILIAICFLYGFSHHLFNLNVAFIVICFVFVMDGILFIVGMSRSMYAKTISSDKSELTSTLSTGISINHLISIVIALLGGLMWEKLGIELLFISAAAFGIGALIFSCFLPKPVMNKIE